MKVDTSCDNLKIENLHTWRIFLAHQYLTDSILLKNNIILIFSINMRLLSLKKDSKFKVRYLCTIIDFFKQITDYWNNEQRIKQIYEYM